MATIARAQTAKLGKTGEGIWHASDIDETQKNEFVNQWYM